jgi:hypothetical protein
MRTVLSQRILSIVALTAIGLAPLAPPAHVHETTTADGQHDAITHRHTALHTGDDDSGEIGRPTRENFGTVEHGGAVVAILDLVSTAPDPGFVPAPYVSSAAVRLDEPESPTTAVRGELVERLIHAPPRGPTASRAPPSTSFL